MDTLFPLEIFMPEGFRYFPDFITESEEMQLIQAIEGSSLRTFVFQGFEAKRKTASFGYDWSFEKRTLTKGKEVPKAFIPLVKKAAGHLSLSPGDFAEVLLTEYPVGAVINWHRDAEPFDLIAGISLMTDCTFRLRPHSQLRQSRSSIISLPVKRRSLYVVQGLARTEWQHSILPVKSLRYSVTLRTLQR